MISKASGRFWKAFERLPSDVKDKAREVYRLWTQDPQHPSLQFKKVHERLGIYSVRVSLGWRALCVKEGGIFIWFWIGSHSEYERILSQL
ncbi:conserved hypothetical protein [Syntrophobacter sp. SbD1]|nr:conserved hypothetical protein [Syntrophobacter sp. SbD1]